VIPAELRAAVDRLAAIVADAPPVDVTLDQCPCTPDTAMLRALLMQKNGALEGRRVLILGDDDSLSVAIGLAGRAFGRGDLTRGVTVVESDPRRVAFLRAAAASDEIAIEVVEHDLRHPLPSRLTRAFDVLATDPPYTLAGARLFLGRGAEALAGDGACYFSFTQWPAPQLAELQRIFLDLGFVVRALHQGFNRYLGASVLGNVGDLIELAQVRAPDADLPVWTGPLYTAEANPRDRVYICAACGAETVLGQDGAPATIAALKAAGCRLCGGKVFRRRAGGPPA
jgi:predicted methyltransferase/DNA-directed RNA polymerase subunit RPC12/RpoP